MRRISTGSLLFRTALGAACAAAEAIRTGDEARPGDAAAHGEVPGYAQVQRLATGG
ncbi:hypothetical protein [Streptomyces sp. NPDC093707]|uniref:hypothetical protein n=1 Tax=Streptomyces sp. NPDC093707 TaxID=3154984 RepID=UPI00344B9C95